MAQGIIPGLLIQWSRVRFPVKPVGGHLAASSSRRHDRLRKGETSTVAPWSQQDMVLGPKAKAKRSYGPVPTLGLFGCEIIFCWI